MTKGRSAPPTEVSPTEVSPTDDQVRDKAQLQRQMEEARQSISQTVEEIKETFEDQYESVKQTVAGVLDFREQFQKDPLVWSLGALSAGFALGYTLGYAHKNMQAAGHKHSEIIAFADSLVDELGTLGNSLVLPPLNAKLKELFGLDLSGVLGEIRDIKKATPRKPAVAKVATRKSVARKTGVKNRKTKATSKSKP